MKIDKYEFHVCCSNCGKEFEITIHTPEGYITFDREGNTAKFNTMSDNFHTVDLFCSDSCKNNGSKRDF